MMVVKKFIDYFKSKKDIVKSHLFKKTDKYVCRKCLEILPEDEMLNDDPSVCKKCSESN